MTHLGGQLHFNKLFNIKIITIYSHNYAKHKSADMLTMSIVKNVHQNNLLLNFTPLSLSHCVY